MSKTFPASKDPDEVKDFGVNWIPRLGTDDIVSSDWSITIGAGLVIDSDSFNNSDTVDGEAAKTTTVWLSGGTTVVGTYELLNRITTSGGRTYDQTVKLKVKDH